MTELWIYLVLTFIVGLIIKYSDQLEDVPKNKKKKKYAILFAILWGIVLGFLISKTPYSMILTAGIFAMVIMRKIDTLSHVVGVLIATTTAFLFGLPPFDVLAFTTFVLFASIDEWDDFIFFGKPKWVQDFRPFLEIGAIVIGLYSGNWLYLAGILVFDLGYVSMMFLTSEKDKNKEEGEENESKTKKVKKRAIRKVRKKTRAKRKRKKVNPRVK